MARQGSNPAVLLPAPNRDIVEHIGRQIDAVRDLRTLADRLVAALSETFAADAAVLYIVHDQVGLAPLASCGLIPEEEAQAVRVATVGHPHWVIHSRRSLLSLDTSQDPRVVPLGHGLRCQSIVCAPLLCAGNRCVGAIEVAHRSPYAFRADDLNTLEAIASLVARPVGSAARLMSAERRADQLRRISVANQAIAAANGLRQVADRSAKIAHELFEVAEASVIILDGEGRIEIAAHHAGERRPVPITDGEIGPLLARPGPLAIPDLRNAAGFGDLYLRLLAAGVHSLLVVPIVRSGRDLGALILYAGLTNLPFDRQTQEAAAIVAGQIAVAVENARLYEALLAAQQRAAAVIAMASTGMLVVDGQGRILEANPAAGTILQCPSERLIGWHVDNALGEPVWERIAAMADAAGPSSAPIEHTLRTGPLASETNVLISVGCLPEGYLLSMADVTQLREVDRLKTQLLSNVSHELRSPLAAIRAYAELLREGIDGGDTALRMRFLSVIEQQTDRVAQTVANLLDLARIESAGYRLRPEPCSLAGLIGEAIEAVAIRSADREVAIEVRPMPEWVVRVDRTMVLSMLRNLIDNAVKFSHQGGRVVVSCRHSDGWLRIAVRDFGIGIPPDEQHHLFKKFVRLPSAKRVSAEGTGLGLVIAYQAARAHGGDIRVRSVVDRGTTFTVLLPEQLIEPFDATAPD